MTLLQLPAGRFLAKFQTKDRDRLMEFLNDAQIQEQTLRLPNPYTLESAVQWLAIAAKSVASERGPMNFSIRDEEDQVIGGVGFDRPDSEFFRHRAEIGYWLARPYWNRGIMSSAVRAACLYAFQTLGVSKVTAHLFAPNVGSARVLEKCGFEFEGYLKQHYCKAGKLIDSKVYGLVRP